MRRLLAGIFCVLAVPISAAAETFTADFLRLGNAQAITVVDGGIGRNVWAGELIWNGYDPAPSGFGGDFYTYCVDLRTVLVDPQTFEIRSTDAMPVDGAQVAWLANAYAPAIHAVSGSVANAMAAGLQLAIWNVLYDNDFSVSSNAGALWSSSAGVVGYANTYLAALNVALNAGPLNAHAIWLDTGTGQDQVTVPEPATLLLLGLGAGALAGGRRRFRHA